MKMHYISKNIYSYSVTITYIHSISIVESLGFSEEKNKESEQGGRTRRVTEKAQIVIPIVSSRISLFLFNLRCWQNLPQYLKQLQKQAVLFVFITSIPKRNIEHNFLELLVLNS